MNRLRPRELLCALALALTFSSSALGFGSQNDQPIHVASDRAELDDQKGISTYSGDVVITQGLAKMEADKVVVYSDKNGLIKIVATGNPAHYQDQQDLKSPATHAYAETIIYTKADETVQMLKNARLEQDKNSFQSDEITYYISNRKVSAVANKENGGGRVEMTILPSAAKPKAGSPGTTGNAAPAQGEEAPKP